MEEWRQIPGFGLHYEASSLGRTRTKEREVVKFSAVAGKVVTQRYKARVHKPCPDGPYGHLCVTLGVDGKRFKVHVARLVLLAFDGPPPPGMEACHGDGDASNNRPGNLRWDTHEANNADRKAHGRYAVGVEHHGTSLTEQNVIAIRASSSTCRELASQFNVGTSTISRIRNRKVWAHVA